MGRLVAVVVAVIVLVLEGEGATIKTRNKAGKFVARVSVCGKINNSQKKKIAASIVLFAYVWEFVSVRARCACVCVQGVGVFVLNFLFLSQTREQRDQKLNNRENTKINTKT